jgi:hypothetical protein
MPARNAMKLRGTTLLIAVADGMILSKNIMNLNLHCDIRIYDTNSSFFEKLFDFNLPRPLLFLSVGSSY